MCNLQRLSIQSIHYMM